MSFNSEKSIWLWQSVHSQWNCYGRDAYNLSWNFTSKLPLHLENCLGDKYPIVWDVVNLLLKLGNIQALLMPSRRNVSNVFLLGLILSESNCHRMSMLEVLRWSQRKKFIKVTINSTRLAEATGDREVMTGEAVLLSHCWHASLHSSNWSLLESVLQLWGAIFLC